MHRDGDRLSLRLVQVTSPEAEPHLLAALRQLIAKDVPMGGLVSELGNELTARLQGALTPEVDAALRELLELARQSGSKLSDVITLSSQLTALAEQWTRGGASLEQLIAREATPELRALLQAFSATRPGADALRAIEALLRAVTQPEFTNYASLKSLLGTLSHYRFDPGEHGSVLRSLLTQGGSSSGAALLAAAQQTGVDSLARALDQWLSALGLKTAPDGKPFGPASVQRALVAALGAIAPDLQATSLAQGELVILQREVVRRMRSVFGIVSVPDDDPLAQRTQIAAFRRVLFNLEDGLHPLAKRLLAAAWSGLEKGLDGRLLEALVSAQDGDLKTLMARTFSALEVERLMNIARHDSGEGLHWTFPVPDAGGLTNVSLAIREELGSQHDEDEANERGVRVTVGVDFSRLGPVRADFVLRNDHWLCD